MGLFDGAIEQLSRGLSYATARHTVLAKNIANAETPGYRARDLVFDDYLNALRGRDAGELSPDPVPAPLPATRVIATIDGPGRQDGNTVHIDKQMARIAENTLYQHTLVQLLAGQFTALKQAISGRV
jgi:flagellar basal-body rod protein FlgB